MSQAPLPAPAVLAMAIAAALIVLGGPVAARAQPQPPAESRGLYAPEGDCTREPRVRVDDGVTIEVSGQITRIAPVGLCTECASGRGEISVAKVGLGGLVDPVFRIQPGPPDGLFIIDALDARSRSPALQAVSAASPLRRCAQ